MLFPDLLRQPRRLLYTFSHAGKTLMHIKSKQINKKALSAFEMLTTLIIIVIHIFLASDGVDLLQGSLQ